MNTNKMFEEDDWKQRLAGFLHSQRFAFYGSIRGLSLEQILKDMEGDFHLVAIAENSGCEGCYCEVARVEGGKAYRYAHCKYFGGEIDGYEGDTDTAEAAAYTINQFFPHAALVHLLPSYPPNDDLAKVTA